MSFCISCRGIFMIFEIMPRPEDICLRLSMSAWFTAPMSGAVMMYVNRKSRVPVRSIMGYEVLMKVEKV